MLFDECEMRVTDRFNLVEVAWQGDLLVDIHALLPLVPLEEHLLQHPQIEYI